jgi:DNA-damage-inducible protein D
MEENKSLAVFENKRIRRHYDADSEVWYFSLVDIVEALTESTNPTDYLKKIRKRDTDLYLYLGTNCPLVAMLSYTRNHNVLGHRYKNKI